MGDLRRYVSAIWLLLPAAIVAFVVLSWPDPVSAQCGSSASSCKNCHEVQDEYPVNSSGDWHVSHAFGDFCEFCHAGNVQATEMEAAHTGMVYPLQNVNASCLSCHPDDVAQKAEVYAVALGVTVGTGDGAAGGDAGGDDASLEEPQGETPVTQADAPAEEGQGEIVDFNSQYARTVLDERPPVNVGNAILTALSIGFFALGGVLVWRWEGLGQRWRALRGQPATGDREVVVEATAAAREMVRPVGRGAVAGVEPHARRETQRPQLADALQDVDPSTVRALETILAEPQTGEAMIQALAKLDPRLVRVVAQLDKEERALLMAVVEAMGATGGRE